LGINLCAVTMFLDSKICSKLAGRIEANVPLSTITWLSVGGAAEYIFYPQDSDDLALFLSLFPEKERFVLGAGSNILVRDGGVPGIVIKIGRGFRQFKPGENYVDLGAGLLDRYVAQQCQMLGLSGFEFMITIPGTIGGGLAMNASCYGSSFADRLIHAWVMDPDGKTHIMTPEALNYEYRFCGLPQGWFFLGGRFRCTPSHPDLIAATMAEMMEMREQTQPTQVKTGGSTFANPAEGPAWQWIDQVGFRGKKVGQAMFSEKHCNFLINLGNCTALDLESLAEEARKAVYEQTGILLRWEIVRWGDEAAL
jgi:UDP-N-acetylmuramate dehydrogenase